MEGNQVRAELLERVLERWGKIREHHTDGSGLKHFKEETGDRNGWGGAEQIAVFAHIHNIQQGSSCLWNGRAGR
eukprot:16371433-Heterocapsa_arctica.AAC.1